MKTKKILSLFLALIMTLSLLPVGAWAAGGTLEGAGTADSPYMIADAADLEEFRELTNVPATKSICGKLTSDIDLKKAEWKPISNVSLPGDGFAGTFDGDGHTIMGLSIPDSAASYQGLFGTVNGGTIKNLKVTGAVSSTGNYIGGIVGRTQGTVTIQNCSYAGSVNGTYTGGIVGRVNSGKVIIKNCANLSAVTGTYVGGILGYVTSASNEIENCYNTGTISGSNCSGGIAGQVANTTSIKNCYNIGTISGVATNKSGISGFNNQSTSNCFYADTKTETPGGSTPTATNGISVIDKSTFLTVLGTAFVADTGNTNNGYPILVWQAGVDNTKNPHIDVSGSATLSMKNDGTVPQTTLTVNYVDMDDTPVVTWSVKNDSDVIALKKPENADANNSTVVVTASKPGKATVVATAGTYSCEYEIKIVPYVTTVEIENVTQPGAVAIGQTVKAKVNVLGGAEYDYTNYPTLSFQWYCGTNALGGATGSTYTIPNDGSFKEWDKLGVAVKCAGKDVHSYTDQQASVRSADFGTLYPVAYDEAFSLPADIKTDGNLTLPATYEKGGVNANITWESNVPAVIAADGSVIRPTTGKTAVKLTAKYANGTASCNRTFDINVWSKTAVEEENSKQHQFESAVSAALGNGALYPVFGKDVNVVDMVKTKLNDNNVNVSIKSVETVYGGAGIDKSGAITYFYADPNTTPTVKFGSYKVTFTLSNNGASVEKEVPVIVYWDRDKVKSTMNSEILDKVSADLIKGDNAGLDSVSSNLTLPRVVDGKKWALVSWTSSNENVLSISNENQQTADTLFDPYVGVVKLGSTEQKVTLTATLTFQFTNDSIGGSEQPISFHQTYNITVPAMNEAKAAEIRAGLLSKLDAGLAKTGLTDAVTGDQLVATAVVNNIQFPTTRDFGVDGKYYPVTITSSDKATIVPPDVNNAARVSVYRPLPGNAAKDVTLTLTITDKNNGVSASKDLKVRVLPLTQDEINTEIKLMEQVKAHYFDGIKNANTDAKSITTNLHAFQEAYLDNSNLTWVYDSKNLKNHGIVPEAMNGWEELEQWRCFRSSNTAVISNENLLVTRQTESKAVTVTSCLSSEEYGKYAVRYPNNADFQKLYYQPVSADLIVTGTNPTSVGPVAEKLTVSFTLQSADSTWIPVATVSGLAEGSTVFDVFNQVLKQNGYGFDARGSYVYAVTNPSGKKLGEFDEGKDSGWMYKVNGVLPSAYMAACPLKNNDSIVVFFTKDYTQEAGHMGEQPKPETVSVSDGKGGVAVTATVSGKTATIAVTDEQVAKLTAVDSSKTVKLDMTSLDKTVSRAVVPAKLASAMGADPSKSLEIALPGGTVKLDGKALAKTAAAGKDVTVSLETVESGKLSTVQKQTLGSKAASAVVVDINVLVDGGKTTSFDGGIVSVAVPYAPKSGEDTSSLTVWYLADDGTITPMHGSFDAATKSVTFSTPHLSSYAVVSFPFADISEDAWYYGNAAYAYVNGLLTGTSATTFAPESTMTRAMLAEVLYRMAGSPAVSGKAAFSDVSDGAWYANAVNWAAKNGIVTGVGEASFAPEQSVTREQIAAMLCRYAKLKGESVSATSDITKFADAAQVSGWAASSMQWAVSTGLFKGNDGALTPTADATRAQTSAILQRYQKTEKAA